MDNGYYIRDKVRRKLYSETSLLKSSFGFRSKTVSNNSPVKANTHKGDLKFFNIDTSVRRQYARLEGKLREDLTEGFRYDWLFKQWEFIRSLILQIPVYDTFRVLNWKRVQQSVKAVRIPRSEPFLIKIFSKYLRVKLPESSPLKAEDVKVSDDACFARYCSDKRFKIRNYNAFYRALDKTLVDSGFMQNTRFKMWSIEEVFEKLPSNTSSCYPLMVKKKELKARLQVRDFLFGCLRASEDTGTLMRNVFKHLTVVFHRTSVVISQIKPRLQWEPKVRQVFGVPFALNALECMLFGPFYESILEHRGSFAIGSTRPQISGIIRNLVASGKRYVICGDFSKFDSTIPPEMVMLFFSSVIQCSRLPGGLKTLGSVLAAYLTFTPFIGYDCKVRTMVGGNASGMYSTTILNSFIVLLCLQYAHIDYFGYPADEKLVSTLGDDFVIATDELGFYEHVVSVMDELGIKINSSKTHVADISQDSFVQDKISYLGFNWNLRGIPDQTIEWVVSHVCYPERNVEGIEGADRVIFRLCSVIFQMSSGPRLFDVVSVYDKKLQEKLRNSGGSYQIRVIKDDGSVSDISIPIARLYMENWKLF